jgi:alkylation response protein AidB-like acyl-CoA dehydrogenase
MAGPRAFPALSSKRTHLACLRRAGKEAGLERFATAQVIFEDCRVPVANRVGAEGDGFRFAMAGLDGGRLNIGACSLGGAQRCLDEAIGYTKDRQQFGQPIADFQNTQFMLADMATDLEAARALLYMAAAKVSAGAPDKSLFGDGQAAGDRQRQRRLSTMRCSCSAAMAICATIRSNASGATCASIRSSKAPIR